MAKCGLEQCTDKQLRLELALPPALIARQEYIDMIPLLRKRPFSSVLHCRRTHEAEVLRLSMRK